MNGCWRFLIFFGWGIQCRYLNGVSEVVVVQLQIIEVSKFRSMHSGELEDSHHQSSGMWGRCSGCFFVRQLVLMDLVIPVYHPQLEKKKEQ